VLKKEPEYISCQAQTEARVSIPEARVTTPEARVSTGPKHEPNEGVQLCLRVLEVLASYFLQMQSNKLSVRNLLGERTEEGRHEARLQGKGRLIRSKDKTLDDETSKNTDLLEE
jgi:hypothetical protein